MMRGARIAGESKITIGKSMCSEPLNFGKDRAEHIISEHELFEFSKLEQGIFREDSIKTTVSAWERM
jgi:hypothetical protein